MPSTLKTMSQTCRPSRRRAILASACLVLAALPAGCGGGGKGSSSNNGRIKDGVEASQVDKVKLGSTVQAIEERFGKPEKATKLVSRQVIQGQPKGYDCIYYPPKGGKQGDYIQFCFKKGRLQTKGSVVTPPPPKNQ